MLNLKTGDSITFRALCRFPTRTITRTINGFTADGRPLAAAYDLTGFIVNHSEISAVNGIPVDTPETGIKYCLAIQAEPEPTPAKTVAAALEEHLRHFGL